MPKLFEELRRAGFFFARVRALCVPRGTTDSVLELLTHAGQNFNLLVSLAWSLCNLGCLSGIKAGVTAGTVPPLALCKKVRRPGFATWRGKTTSRKPDAPFRVHAGAVCIVDSLTSCCCQHRVLLEAVELLHGPLFRLHPLFGFPSCDLPGNPCKPHCTSSGTFAGTVVRGQASILNLLPLLACPGSLLHMAARLQ